ncbi:hypothetical protein IBT47_09790 [Erwinia sp. S43]|uniref:hypothetical protein n=1 Tax=Erwinia sp. S43 TaxID=2769339 RepID=UPI00190E549F|nr:hypothetical protein [Erwinia sp. S43]MBK0032575.1 hypothetical protein [Erwinia sp. S43]
MLLALDFDGVVVDGIDECLLVAWNVFHDNPADYFNRETLRSIPEKFKDGFKLLRSYVRHDGHFIVPFHGGGAAPTNSRSFAESYETIPSDIRHEFRQAFVAYREAARRSHPAFWAELHVPLIDIERLFSVGHEVRIVSGKDTPSICSILRQHGVNLAEAHVFGRMTDKREVLAQLKKEADDKGQSMTFLDDNIENVVEAKQLGIGINALWANWGCRSPDHQAVALANAVTEVTADSLFDFLRTSD